MRKTAIAIALTMMAAMPLAAQQVVRPGHSGHQGAGHQGHAGHAAHGSKADSAFQAVQARGNEAMGVDQYTSTHRFDSLADGGRIELQRDTDDPAGVETIRAHLRGIAEAFAKGDFRAPGFVHAQEMPGTAVMAARRSALAYTYRDLPRGGEVRIVTRDLQALRAVHEFLAFQRSDHRAGGHEHHHR